MKTIPLRQLLREPLKVKKIIRTGQSVQITDKGESLWILHPANSNRQNPERDRAIDELLDEVLREPVSTLSLSKIIKDSRR